MNIENNERLTQIYQFYGILLTDTQRQYFSDYYFDDFSLAEIAENAGVSRQAVFDNLKRTAKLLEDYEAKLGLADNFAAIDQGLDSVLASLNEDNKEQAILKIQQIKQLIEEN